MATDYKLCELNIFSILCVGTRGDYFQEAVSANMDGHDWSVLISLHHYMEHVCRILHRKVNHAVSLWKPALFSLYCHSHT